ncbi:MAG: 30S ribosomal protein S12 methylthiotransferase RimO [Desulfonatronovibrio sp.]
MKKIKIFTRSLGCPKNLVDTENILGGFGSLYEPAQDIFGCQVVLINTCAFIQPAVEESLDVIFSAYDDIKGLENPPLLAVTGCLVSRYGSGLGSEIPEADIFASIREQKKLPGLILKRLGQSISMVSPARKVSTPGSYAFLKVSEGCNNKCSFCTIPSIRGRLKSSPVDDIVAQASSLLEQGVKELVVVAQDSTAYGRDIGYTPGLAGLLQELSSLEGLRRLRCMYMYPSGLDRKLLEGIARIGEPVVPYFDVPFQHSHPDVLKRMGRPFKDDPRKIIQRIRDVFPESALRTTLITGYPGETREHFEHLLEFVKEARFQHLGVFPFYSEAGVRASTFSGQISPEIREKRAQKVMCLQKKISRQGLRVYKDQLLDILVDSPHPEWPGLFTGRTWFQAPDVDGLTYVSGPDTGPGQMVRARVQETKDYDLIALQD